MKRATILFVLATALLAAWYVGSPYYTLYQMNAALQSQDAEELERYIDFEEVRKNLAAQAIDYVPVSEDEGFVGLVARSVAADMGGRALENILTPETLSLLAAGAVRVNDAAKGDEPVDIGALAERVDIDRTAFTGFSVAVDGSQRARFSRAGLGYKLTSIRLPDAQLQRLLRVQPS